jgi:hypothetical protein
MVGKLVCLEFVIALTILYQWIILLIVIPFGLDCDSNDVIPDYAIVDLSMHQWKLGGAISAFFPSIFCLTTCCCWRECRRK